MLKRDDLLYKNLHIPCWRHDPKRPEKTIIFLSGTETNHEMYEEFFRQFRKDRILLVGMYEGSHPIESIERGVNLVMTFYRHTSKTTDLSRHSLMGYSVGGLVAAHLAADHGGDHPAPEDLVMLCPAIPGIPRRLAYYERNFLRMGTRLQFGSEGKSGVEFAAKHGTAFMFRVLLHKRRRERLLESIATATLPGGSIHVPTLAVLNRGDEFFSLREARGWVESTCDDVAVEEIEGSHARILHAPEDAIRAIKRYYGGHA